MEKIEDDIHHGIYAMLQQLNESDADELFSLLTHISPQLGHLLPLNCDQSVNSSLAYEHFMNGKRKIFESKHQCEPSTQSSLEQLTITLASYYLERIRKLFSVIYTKEGGSEELEKPHNWCRNNNLRLICCFLERVRILLGDKLIEDRIHSIISRRMDLLLQQHLTYLPNVLSKIEDFKRNFVALALHTKILIKDVIFIFTCSGLYKDKTNLFHVILDTILEKLSIELFTLADSMKDELNKLSSKMKSDKQENINSNTKVTFSLAVSSENVYLSTESTVALSEIVGVFLSIEDELENSITLNVAQQSINALPKKGVLKHSFELPDLIRSSQHSTMHKTISGMLDWNWYEGLKELIPYLSNSLIHDFHQKMQVLLEEAKDKFYKSNLVMYPLQTTQSQTTLLMIDQICFPKRVLYCVGHVLHVMMKYLPLGSLGLKYKPMAKLQTDFLNSCNQSLKEIKLFLMNLMEDLPEKIPPTCLPILFSTSLDVLAVLQYCSKNLHQDIRVSFNGTIQAYKSFCDQLQEHTTQYHKTKVITALLHDAESNYWTDPREFCEGERCSYSIEMWSFYLKNLSKDLHSVFAHEMAMTILGDIFCESLSILSNRYCACKPSYKRHNQINLDVQSILEFCFEFFWEIIPVASKISRREVSPSVCKNDEVLSKIHTSCTDLFTFWLVMASSLSDLYAVSTTIEHSKTHNTPTLPYDWVSFVMPMLFPLGWNGKFESLDTFCQILCRLKHMIHNPDRYLQLTVEVLTLDKCYMAKQMMTGAVVLEGGELSDIQKNILDLVALYPRSLGILTVQCAKSTSDFDLSNFLDLKFLDPELKEERLPWQAVIYKYVTFQVIKSMAQAVEFLLSHAWSATGRDIIRNMPEKLRELVPGYMDEDQTDVLYLCTSLVLEALRSCCMTIDHTALNILLSIDKELCDGGFSDSLQCHTYGAHVLLHVAELVLLDPICLTSLSGVSIPVEMIHKFYVVSQFLMNIQQLQMLCSAATTIGTTSLLKEIKAFKECSSEIFSHSLDIEDLTSTLQSQTLQETTFCHNLSYTGNTSGKESAKHIYNLLCDNYVAIAQQWKIDLTSKFAQGDNILPVSLNCDWKSSILCCLSSLPRDVIVNILRQRPALQENAYLSQDEKECADSIRKYFLI